MASRKDQSKREGTPIYFVVATTSHCYSGCHKEKNVFDHCHGSGSSKRGAPVMRRHHRSCKDLTLLEYHKPLSPCTSNTSLVQFINLLPSTLSAKCITQLQNSLPLYWGFMTTFSLALFARKSSHGSTEKGKLLSNFTPTPPTNLRFDVLGPSSYPHDDPSSFSLQP